MEPRPIRSSDNSIASLRTSPSRTSSRSSIAKSRSGRVPSITHRSFEDGFDDILVQSAGSSPVTVSKHKKTPSYRRILTKIRDKHRLFSVMVVGDVSSGPIPLMSSLLETSFRLKWESSSVYEGMWEWTSSSREKRVTLQLSGMTFDPNQVVDSTRSSFLADVRTCDVLVLTFSLVSPLSLQRAVRTSQLAAVGGSKHPPLVFLIGTLRELRDAIVLKQHQVEGFQELVRHYVNQKLLSTEDAKAFANGSLRIVSEAKVREAMLACNATFFAESCFLPSAGNVADMFGALAEKAYALRKASSHHAKPKHRRSRSMASAAVVPSDDESDSEGEIASGLASARMPDPFTMQAMHEVVVEWLEDELPSLVRPPTPREGLSRSAYQQLLLQESPPSHHHHHARIEPPQQQRQEQQHPQKSAQFECPANGVHRKEWPTGDTYEGGWLNHLYDGPGRLWLTSGCSYQGSFRQGLFHGEGEFRSPDKAFYRGSWTDGKRNGKGEQRYADGSSYVGYWKDDLRHGEGVLSYANGTIYAGGFQEDLFHGRGRYTFNTGSTYEGSWQGGQKTGTGTLHRYDGTVRRLTYKDDVLLAQETITNEVKKKERKLSLRTQLSNSAFMLMTALDVSQLRVEEDTVLGEGFYGIVFRGAYKQQDVAVKRLRPNIPDNVLAKFLAEVTILAGLEHEHVVHYLGAVFEEKNLCIVTAYYGGGTLWEKIHDTSAQFTMAFIHKICSEIASAMRYLHFECQPAIIHRDLKSPNVLLTTDLSVKLADFGLARHLQSSAEMTKGIGTASWSAPEILRSQSYAASADVYSFAIIVWELFARKPPFHPLERDQILLAVAVDNARPEMPPNVPVAYRSLMENCWQTDPEERPDFKEIFEWFQRNQ